MTPKLIHLTTTDMSLDWLLGPQLAAFRDAGFEVIGASAPGPHVAAIEAAGIRHIPLRHATRAMAPHRDLATLAELVGVFRRERPDVVHTHNPKPGLYGRVAARLAGVPAIVNTVHGLYALPDDPLPKRAVVYGLERVAAFCSHRELLQNPEDVRTLRRLGIGSKKLKVLGNGIDLERFDARRIPPGTRERLREEWGAGPDTVVVGLVGRLVAEKGYREVFEAARQLRGSQPEILFVVVGPPDPDKADGITEGDIAAAEADGVRFLGRRDDVDSLYVGFDIYALASWREGFPRSAMEAAAMGLPIVATDIRGCRQVVDHGVTGMLVPLRDPAALAASIADLASDPARRKEMAVAARRRAEREFDQQRVIDITLRAYREVMPPARFPTASR